LGGGVELKPPKPKMAVASHGTPPLPMVLVLISNECVLISKYIAFRGPVLTIYLSFIGACNAWKAGYCRDHESDRDGEIRRCSNYSHVGCRRLLSTTSMS
jgi:hypothetical protein